MKKFWSFIFAVVVSFIPGIIGVFFTPHGDSHIWYESLSKSVLTPAGWVFSVAWTILYLLLGIALFLIINNKTTRIDKSKSYWLFFGQMVLNALWSIIFFGMHMPALGLLALIMLIVVSIFMERAFRPISKAAAYLVWPYIIWMCFATYLNATIMFLN
ncbi:MAG: tryptophan-rich sensory protein [Alphaproteobacteria bacterium]|nr:tryptophan-rich sensory protein [Alphaproteobacteria bacterium]